MTTPRFDDLPPTLATIRTRPLFVMRLDVKPILAMGDRRRVGVVPGGSFEGERLRGHVLDGGSDWQSIQADGATGLDVRLMLRTDDDALIGMSYQGRRHGPAEVLARIARGETVEADAYYFRINPLFETAAPAYAWLNHLVALGVGHRLPDGPVYSVFEVL